MSRRFIPPKHVGTGHRPGAWCALRAVWVLDRELAAPWVVPVPQAEAAAVGAEPGSQGVLALWVGG